MAIHIFKIIKTQNRMRMTISNELRVLPLPDQRSTREKTREKRQDALTAPNITVVPVAPVSENFDRVPNPNPAIMVVDEPVVV